MDERASFNQHPHIHIPSPPTDHLSTTMGSDTSTAHPLHVLFFPLMAPGHMSPMVDIAKLFASHGVKSTILTTPANAQLILPSISSSKTITLSLIPFPSAAVGLPDGCENLSSIPLSQQPVFLQAVSMLRRPFDQILTDLHPDCVVTDSFLPWTHTIAADHNIPRLVFHGTCFFSLCASDAVARHGIPGDEHDVNHPVVLPGLPHRIEMLRHQIPDWTKASPDFYDLISLIIEYEPKSYGVVVNSFYELEPDYAKHYREVVGRRSWHIGPVSLCSKVPDEMRNRGSKASIDWKYCSDWLDTRAKSSVVYVCFGSLSDVPAAQLREIALGLEASGHPFIWAVKTTDKGDGDGWIPDGYEERIGGRGMVIRGWAPQLMILDHPAVGGFVTHCGWNSTLEGVTAGLPMATWPLFAEQFYNERMVVDVLGIGVAIGVEKHARVAAAEREVVAAERVEAAVRELMGGGEVAEERRRRVRELGEMARRAVEEGGSSYVDLEKLIQELLLERGK